MKAYLNSGIAN